IRVRRFPEFLEKRSVLFRGRDRLVLGHRHRQAEEKNCDSSHDALLRLITGSALPVGRGSDGLSRSSWPPATAQPNPPTRMPLPCDPWKHPPLERNYATTSWCVLRTSALTSRHELSPGPCAATPLSRAG